MEPLCPLPLLPPSILARFEPATPRLGGGAGGVVVADAPVFSFLWMLECEAVEDARWTDVPALEAMRRGGGGGMGFAVSGAGELDGRLTVVGS